MAVVSRQQKPQRRDALDRFLQLAGFGTNVVGTVLGLKEQQAAGKRADARLDFDREQLDRLTRKDDEATAQEIEARLFTNRVTEFLAQQKDTRQDQQKLTNLVGSMADLSGIPFDIFDTATQVNAAMAGQLRRRNEMMDLTSTNPLWSMTYKQINPPAEREFLRRVHAQKLGVDPSTISDDEIISADPRSLGGVLDAGMLAYMMGNPKQAEAIANIRLANDLNIDPALGLAAATELGALRDARLPEFVREFVQNGDIDALKAMARPWGLPEEPGFLFDTTESQFDFSQFGLTPGATRIRITTDQAMRWMQLAGAKGAFGSRGQEEAFKLAIRIQNRIADDLVDMGLDPQSAVLISSGAAEDWPTAQIMFPKMTKEQWGQLGGLREIAQQVRERKNIEYAVQSAGNDPVMRAKTNTFRFMASKKASGGLELDPLDRDDILEAIPILRARNALSLKRYGFEEFYIPDEETLPTDFQQFARAVGKTLLPKALERQEWYGTVMFLSQQERASQGIGEPPPAPLLTRDQIGAGLTEALKKLPPETQALRLQTYERLGVFSPEALQALRTELGLVSTQPQP